MTSLDLGFPYVANYVETTNKHMRAFPIDVALKAERAGFNFVCCT